ncbi:MAG: rRNA maturation RNase YbeY [Lentimicrobium sp.]|jgi:rRNA maturation RNase YbeY|nr:rRNA maturation RNase YbeY [Lentimicrobium sp.]
MKTRIHFFNEDITFRLHGIIKRRTWLIRCIESEGKTAGEVNFIFCSEAFLLKMNIDYLNHDTLTDVITFDYTEGDVISGDVFISLPQVKENAILFSRTFNDELNRVMVHGVLHLCGYKDKTPAREKQMRLKEDEKLKML